MPVVGTRTNASARAYGWSATIPESLDGMVLMMPSSIVSTGTGNSSSIGANGSVTFSSCATLSLNGVFTADYDNYMVVHRGTESQSDDYRYRFRAGGTDNSTGSSYVRQYLLISGTSKTGSRSAADFSIFNAGSQVLATGFAANIYGPYLAQPTAARTVTMNDSSSAQIYDFASTHNQSTSYDGFTIYRGAGTMSGLISVYGLEN